MTTCLRRHSCGAAPLKAFACEWEYDRDILAFFAARGLSEVRRDVQPDGNIYIGVERSLTP